jgi:hypothetical protein
MNQENVETVWKPGILKFFSGFLAD